jgi:hypothetical protein
VEQDVGEVVVVLVGAARAYGGGLREQVAGKSGDLNGQISLGNVEYVLVVIARDVSGATEVYRRQP